MPRFRSDTPDTAEPLPATKKMKISQHKILGKRIFQEVTIPIKTIHLQNDVIAVFHSYYGQWSARHQDIRKKSITLFTQNGDKTIGHIENVKYPLNDIDYDPSTQEVILATGTYDGGFAFEGQLLHWNLHTNQIKIIINDNREFVSCEFNNNSINFKVNPPNDMDENLSVMSYSITRDGSTYELNNLNPIGIVDFDSSHEEYDYKSDLNSIAKAIDPSFEINAITWDICLTNEKVVSSHSNGKIAIHSILSEQTKSIRLREEGDCVQLFQKNDPNKIVINTCYRKVHQEDYNIVYELDLKKEIYYEKAKGKFSLSKNKNDCFLARQTNHNREEDKDRIYNSEFEVILDLNIGHYDLFNHYLRIDNESELFALVGNPRDQHKLKEILRIDQNGKSKKIFSIEDDNPHLMEPNFLKLNDIYVVQGKIYNPNPRIVNHKISGYDEAGKLVWTESREGNAIDLEKLDGFDNLFVAIYSSRKVEIINAINGKTVYNLNEKSMVENCRPLCSSSKKNLLAIGYDNGLIEIFNVNE